MASVKFKGFEKNELLRRFQKALQLTAWNTHANARRIVAVDTGLLRNSIDLIKVNKNHYKIIANTNYARFVEYGTFKMKAQPYMRPSLKLAKNKFFKKNLVKVFGR